MKKKVAPIDDLTLQADALHRSFIAFLAEHHPTASTAVVLTATTYLLGGMAGELARQSQEPGHVDDILETVFAVVREQVQAHLRGLPTRQ